MEVFDLIRTGDLLQSIHGTCIAFIGVSSFFVITLFAIFMAILEETVGEQHHRIIVRCLVGSFICLITSIICINVIPSSSTYYLEAKVKVTKLQNISDKQANDLITYLDYKINETK